VRFLLFPRTSKEKVFRVFFVSGSQCPFLRAESGCKGTLLFCLFPRALRKKFFVDNSWKAPPAEAGCKGSNFSLTFATPGAIFFSTGLSKERRGLQKRAGRQGRKCALVARRLAAPPSAFRIGSAKVVGQLRNSKPPAKKPVQGRQRNVYMLSFSNFYFWYVMHALVDRCIDHTFY
jgi:hypothetical protein